MTPAMGKCVKRFWGELFFLLRGSRFFFLADWVWSGRRALRRWFGSDFEAVPLCKRFGISEAHPAIRAWWCQRTMTNSSRREKRAAPTLLNGHQSPGVRTGARPLQRGKLGLAVAGGFLG